MDPASFKEQFKRLSKILLSTLIVRFLTALKLFMLEFGRYVLPLSSAKHQELISEGENSEEYNSNYSFSVDTKQTNESMDDSDVILKYNKCPKSEHHSKFRSVSELELDSLPERLRTEEVLKFVKLAASIVVRLCVSFTSKKRHGKFTMPSQGATGGRKTARFSNVKRYASGWVCLPSEHDREHHIRVITARHVIYNSIEARNTEVTFFFDGTDQKQMEVTQGVCVNLVNDDRDFVILECKPPQDESLRQRLSEALTRLGSDSFGFESISRDISLNTRSWHSYSKYSHSDSEVIVISHPHGGSKHVTFGSCVGSEDFDTEFDMRRGQPKTARCIYKYDAPTCPGSSGAPVIIIGKPGVSYYWTPHSHVDNDGNGVSVKGLVNWRGRY